MTNQSNESSIHVAATPKARPSFTKPLIILLIILAATIGLPIVLSLLSILFTLVVLAASLVFAFFVTGLSFVGGGLLGLATMPFAAFDGISNAMLVGGTSLIGIGLGIIILVLNAKLAGLMYGACRFVWKKLTGRRRKHGE